jgi:ABC-2 type transport system ATP-binding protein
VSSPANAIEVTGLVKHYGDVKAVDGVDLHVARGELVALLGPNGAGKTTTVEILEGYRVATAGTVRVLGVDPASADRHWKARIGIVLQEAADSADLTVAEVVTHYAKYYPDPRDPADVIAAVGLTEKTKSRVDALSGGQRRRLDVALGILGRPELLFLDEPTTGFDPEARRDFWDLIEGLHAAGTTILLTTHYMEEAERLADRVVIIVRGQIVANGTPESIGGRQRMEASVSWIEGGLTHTESTPSPTALVAELSTRLGGEVDGLTVVRPTLEDIYMQLVEKGASDGNVRA